MTTFTVTFLHTDGSINISRYFDTKRAAQKWAKWLRTTQFTVKTFVYEGPAGGNLLEEVAA